MLLRLKQTIGLVFVVLICGGASKCCGDEPELLELDQITLTYQDNTGNLVENDSLFLYDSLSYLEGDFKGRIWDHWSFNYGIGQRIGFDPNVSEATFILSGSGLRDTLVVTYNSELIINSCGDMVFDYTNFRIENCSLDTAWVSRQESGRRPNIRIQL